MSCSGVSLVFHLKGWVEELWQERNVLCRGIRSEGGNDRFQKGRQRDRRGEEASGHGWHSVVSSGVTGGFLHVGYLFSLLYGAGGGNPGSE